MFFQRLEDQGTFLYGPELTHYFHLLFVDDLVLLFEILAYSLQNLKELLFHVSVVDLSLVEYSVKYLIFLIFNQKLQNFDFGIELVEGASSFLLFVHLLFLFKLLNFDACFQLLKSMFLDPFDVVIISP